MRTIKDVSRREKMAIGVAFQLLRILGYGKSRNRKARIARKETYRIEHMVTYS